MNTRNAMNENIAAAAMTVAIARGVPSKVSPTINAAEDAKTNCTNDSNDDALPPTCGNGVSAPAVACGIVVINPTM